MKELTLVGWREWVELPDLGVGLIKAKIDTGARTSALHAFDLRIEPDGDGERATFEVHPLQRSRSGAARVAAPVAGWRRVRPSSGHVEVRPVIKTRMVLGGRKIRIELTLSSRDQMGFRMLIGRQAIRRRFVVDAGRSFLGGRAPDDPGHWRHE